MAIGVTGPSEYFGKLNIGSPIEVRGFTSSFFRGNKRVSTAIIQGIIGQKDESEAITAAVDFLAYLLTQASKGSTVIIRDENGAEAEVLRPPSVA